MGCKTTANYNTKNNKRGIYCAVHKTTDMICVTAITCKHKDCNHRPCFNIEGTKKGLYCYDHKLPNMINVVMRRCMHAGCDIYPTFNNPGIKSPLYCNSHKLPNMINVVDNKCIIVGCNIRPIFNYPNEIKASHCKLHKLEGMEAIIGHFCIYDGCKTRSIYNMDGEKTALYCNLHKLDGMINIKDKKCIEIGCTLLPSFNVSGSHKGIYCAKHRKPDMINVIEKTCKTPLCDTQVKEKYDGYCLRCFMYQYPDKPVSRNYKTKETYVIDYLKTNFVDYKLICDKRIIGGDSYKRPDILLDLSSHNIIIEIDENQHNRYDCSCENKRIMQLSSDIKHKPIVFIRFNPDKYIDASNNLIESCWKIDGNGISCIKNEVEWSKRLVSLKEQITYWLKNSTKKMIEIVQLYYDQN